MCIIAVKPAGVKLPKDLLEEAFRSNKDGAGLAYINEDNNLTVTKGFFSFQKFYEHYKEYEDSDMLIHCRISTAGLINEENCHPFFVPCIVPRYAFAVAHNGRLPHYSTKELSDTACFVRDRLKPQLWRDPSFFQPGESGQFFVEEFMGKGNKIVVMRYDAQEKKTTFTICNDQAGHRAHGCWFSNHSYVKTVYRDFGPQADYMKELDTMWNNKFIQDKDHPNKAWIKKDSIRGAELIKKNQAEFDKARLAEIDRLREQAQKNEGRVRQTPPPQQLHLLPPVKTEPVDLTNGGLTPSDMGQLTDQEWQVEVDLRMNEEGPDEDMGDEALAELAASFSHEEINAAGHLKHLSKGQKLDLRRWASDFWKAHYTTRKNLYFDSPRQIIWMRNDVREFFPAAHEYDDATLDRWILYSVGDAKGQVRDFLLNRLPDEEEQDGVVAEVHKNS